MQIHMILAEWRGCDGCCCSPALANGVFSVNPGVSVFSVSPPPSRQREIGRPYRLVVELKQWCADIICLYSMDREFLHLEKSFHISSPSWWIRPSGSIAWC